MTGLSVSIVTFNTWERTAVCAASVDSALRDTGIAFETLVWDNGTDPPPADIDPSIVVRRSGVNFGYGAGHNSNAALAQYPYLLILNPDTSLLSGCAERLLAVMETGRDVAAAAPVQLDQLGRLQLSVRRLPTLRTELARVVGADRKVGSPWSTLMPAPTTGIIQAPQPSGAALLTRTDRFLKVGGFDRDFFMYFEDVDLCRRLGELGSIVVVADAQIEHDGEGTARRYRKETTFWIEYSRRAYFRKHFAPLLRVLFYALGATSALSHLFAWFFVSLLPRSDGAEARAKAAGYGAALAATVVPSRSLWDRLMSP